MYKVFKSVICSLLLLFCLIPSGVFGQSIGIGAVTFTPVASAVLEINGVTGFGTPRGLLIPKMNTSQRNMIAGPVSGLLIFNSDDNTFYYWSGTQWVPLATGQGWDLLGNAGTTFGTNFIGTTDQTSFEIRTNNVPYRLVITEVGAFAGNVGIGIPLPQHKLHVVGNIQSTSIIRSVFYEGSSLNAGGPVYAAPGTGRLIIGTANSTDWTIAGNTGINDLIHYIGTNDAADFVVKTNNAERMRVKSGGQFIVNGTLANNATSVMEAHGDATFPWALNGFSGSGTGSPTNWGGVYGESTNGGIGVYGFSDETGVVGAGNSVAPRFYVIGANSGSGLAGTSDYAGVFGSGTNVNGGVGIVGYGNNITTASVPPRGAGVFGEGISFGVYGVAQSLNGTGANFTGGGYFTQGVAYAYVGARYNGTNYKILGQTNVSTIVDDLNGDPVIMFASESPEPYFEDFGEGQLVNGFAHISLDPIFSKNIIVRKGHPLMVFIQLEGDCNGVFVENKTVNGFDVKELRAGTSNVKFTYRVVANIVNSNGSINEGLRFPPGPTKDERESFLKQQH